jgi:hypothetical protein
LNRKEYSQVSNLYDSHSSHEDIEYFTKAGKLYSLAPLDLYFLSYQDWACPDITLQYDIASFSCLCKELCILQCLGGLNF